MAIWLAAMFGTAGTVGMAGLVLLRRHPDQAAPRDPN
jgi:hypothetical protein